MTPTRDQVRRAPKVLLHDHLDGGLRPQTIIELAAEIGHQLPEVEGELTAESLGTWFAEACDSGSLERYLETFDHTVAVMQTAAALTRVARECVEDLAADGVVYAEVRYAPEQHVEQGLTLDEVVAAVQAGFDEGVAAAGGRIVVRQLLTAMRHQARSMEIAELAIAWRDRGRGRLRHRRRRGGLPAHPAPRRVRVPPAGERALHDPRRRGVRAAVDLAGDPVVRRRPARPRRPDHRRHHRRRGRLGRARPARGVRPRQADPAGDVPVVEPADRRRHLDRRAPDRAAEAAPVPGHGQHRQPADEPHLDDPRDVVAGRGVRLRAAATSSGSRSTR